MNRFRFVRPRAAVAAGLLAVLTTLALAGCDSFEKNAYRSLKVAKVEYELLQEEAARAYLDGRISQRQWDHFAVAGHRFIAAHTLAADTMKTYQQARAAGMTEEQNRVEQQVTTTLAQLPGLLADLQALLDSFQAPPPPTRPSAPTAPHSSR